MATHAAQTCEEYTAASALCIAERTQMIVVVFAMVCCSIGLLFAFDGISYKKEQRNPTITLEEPTSDLVVNDIENGASTAVVPGVVIAAAPDNNQLEVSGTGEITKEAEVGQPSAATTATGKKKWSWSMKKSRK